ncbi:carbohydrate ABC transporter permease [Konateibacter massiliensis]|uniref:carbohydrate ABC transporter permease n=1 Tax=Konateibacter massiliensis TaxID=2002841 RepID=UPI000C1466A2|nr:carbohydrate ABC transporter permease [Konateibacter massiliensis]
MNKKGRKQTVAIITHVVMISIGVVMLYPLIWMLFSSFKTNVEIFGSTALLPAKPVWDSFIKGWKGIGGVTYTQFYSNTFKMVIPTVLFTVLSCSLVAYGFARFRFRGKKILFMLMISTLMLPNSVLIIPRYILYNKLEWLNSYLPFSMPALFACYPFFIYMMVQFFRGIPVALDEAAKIDGCNTFQLYWRILIPLMKPALFSAAIFQFIWTWNDFFNSLIYINSVSKFPIVLALRMSLDATAAANWNQVLAMSVLSLLPGTILFFSAQKYFVEGVSAGSVKG